MVRIVKKHFLHDDRGVAHLLGVLILALLVVGVLVGVRSTTSHNSKDVRSLAATTTAVVSFAPDTQTIAMGSTGTVVLNVTSFYPMNAIQTTITYPSDLVDVTVDSSASAFSVRADEVIGVGTIKLSRGSTVPLTGTQPVATFTVIPKTGVGGVATLSPTSTVVVSSATNTAIPSTTANTTIIIPTTVTPTPIPMPSRSPIVIPSPSPIVFPSPSPVAGTAAVSLIPTSPIIAVGSVGTVVLNIAAGGPVNAIQTTITFPANLVDVTIDTSKSAFAINAEEVIGAGTIKISRGSTTPVVGVQQVALLTVKPKPGSSGSVVLSPTNTVVVSSVTNKAIPVTNASATLALSTPFPSPSSIVFPSPSPVVGGSTISISAAGTQVGGVGPTMQLLINGKVVATFQDVGGNPTLRLFKTFTYKHPTKVTNSHVQVAFINDAYDPNKGQDRNLRVNKVVIDSTAYQAENKAVLSVGSWNTQARSCNASLTAQRTEWLVCNGMFQF